MITFRPPTKSDIDYVARHMRPMDVMECRLMGGHGPHEALEAGIAHSTWCFAALVEDEPVCIFGVASEGMLDDEGAPWLLAIRGIERHARALLVGTRAYLPRMTREYETLANVVHAHNRAAIRYLKWCGFKFGAPFDHEGEPFLPFEMKRAA